MSVDDLRRTLIVALLLGATATGAAAWERPKAPPSPKKVESCPGMGEGFVRIPGSETCVRLSGSIRVEASHVGGGAAYAPDGR